MEGAFQDRLALGEISVFGIKLGFAQDYCNASGICAPIEYMLLISDAKHTKLRPALFQ